MSIEPTPNGWRVRWRDDAGRNRAKLIGRKRDAETFDGEVKRLKRMGQLAQLDQGTETLAEFMVEWLENYGVPNLEPKTLKVYASLWDCHVDAKLGGMQLRKITPRVLDEYLGQLGAKTRKPPLAPGTVRKVAGMLQGIFQRAFEWDRIQRNPMRIAHKPRGGRQITITPLAPSVVEVIRQHFISQGRHRDAALTSVLAYAGLRPGEALDLTWGHVGERTIAVRGAVSLGRRKDTKTHVDRTVRLLAPLAQDLAEWKLREGRPSDRVPVFPGMSDAQRLTEGQWNRWTQGAFAKAKKAAGVPTARAYDLRHSFVSLLIHEGVSILEVARQAGHSAQTCLKDYGHLFDEFDPSERQPAEDVIRAARAGLVPPQYLAEGGTN